MGMNLVRLTTKAIWTAAFACLANTSMASSGTTTDGAELPAGAGPVDLFVAKAMDSALRAHVQSPRSLETAGQLRDQLLSFARQYFGEGSLDLHVPKNVVEDPGHGVEELDELIVKIGEFQRQKVKVAHSARFVEIECVGSVRAGTSLDTSDVDMQLTFMVDGIDRDHFYDQLVSVDAALKELTDAFVQHFAKTHQITLKARDGMRPHAVEFHGLEVDIDWGMSLTKFDEPLQLPLDRLETIPKHFSGFSMNSVRSAWIASQPEAVRDSIRIIKLWRRSVLVRWESTLPPEDGDKLTLFEHGFCGYSISLLVIAVHLGFPGLPLHAICICRAVWHLLDEISHPETRKRIAVEWRGSWHGDLNLNIAPVFRGSSLAASEDEFSIRVNDPFFGISYVMYFIESQGVFQCLAQLGYTPGKWVARATGEIVEMDESILDEFRRRVS